ncbi:MAG: glycosyltransferase family 39 protein [Acidobacteriota bacterium]|nr:MAG: glycosyltransferase family 39 protein [Acidobacteriota bacterium]
MAEISKSSQFRFPGPLIWLFVTAILMGYVYMFGLGMPLLGPDEPRYSQVAREMFERGDWVTTTLGGHNWFEKPALLYWMQIVSYGIFGVSEFAARLGSALFGLGTVFALFLVGLKREGGYDVQSGRTPLPYWMMAVSATSLGLIVFSRGASFDIIVTFPLTASLAGFYLWYLSSERNESVRKRAFFLFTFYFFSGVAVLAKGLIGIVFPAAIVGFFYLLRREFPKRDLLVSFLWGPLVAVLTASAWYLPAYLRHGWEFIDEFFVQHHFQRFTSNKYKHPQPFWFFWAIFPLMTIPWVPFFLAAVWKTGRRIVSELVSAFSRKEGPSSEKTDPLAVFAFAWLLVPLAFFSFSGSKLPGYVLPSVPAAAILTALYVDRFAAVSKARDMLCKSLAIAMFVVCFLLLLLVVPRYADDDSTKSLVKAADEAGYRDRKIAGYLGRNHNLEFYAAGRLYREEAGEQKAFTSVDELISLARSTPDGKLLVVTQEWHLDELKKDPGVRIREIARRGENAILVVEAN